MQDNYFALIRKPQSTQQIAASFLSQLSQSLKSASCNEYDLTKLILDKEDRREFVENVAIYFEDEQEIQALKNLEYDPVSYRDWMVADYLAYELDNRLDSRTEEQKWKVQEKFYDMLLQQIDEDINQDYTEEEIEAMKRIQRRLESNK